MLKTCTINMAMRWILVMEDSLVQVLAALLGVVLLEMTNIKPPNQERSLQMNLALLIVHLPKVLIIKGEIELQERGLLLKKVPVVREPRKMTTKMKTMMIVLLLTECR